MHLTINVEHADLGRPHNLRLLAEALLVLAGEKPNTETLTLRVDAGPLKQVIDEIRADLLNGTGEKPREGGLMGEALGDRMAGEGPNFVHLTGSNESVDPAADDRRFAAVTDDDAPPQDDPAAILAAAQAGGIPLAVGSAAVPSGAVVAPSTTAPADTTATSTELDSSGLPWDERIHSGARTKLKDGTWRKRSKLADGEYEQIEAELRIHYPKPAPTPPPPPSGPAGGGSEFAALVERLHAGFRRENDPVTKQQQVDAMKHFGLNGLEDLSKRPDLFEAFAGMLGI